MKRRRPSTWAGFIGATIVSTGAAADPGPTGGDQISPEIRAQISAGLPTYQEVRPAPPSAPYQPADSDSSDLHTAAHIKRLPQPPPAPKGDDFLTAKGKADAAMNQYLGKPDGVDRGFLNKVTLPELWNKIPLLKYLPCPLPGVTNETRATDLKRAADFSQSVKDESDFSALDRLEAEPGTSSK